MSQIQTSWLLSNEIQPFNVTSTAFLLESSRNDKSTFDKKKNESKVAELQNVMCDEKSGFKFKYS